MDLLSHAVTGALLLDAVFFYNAICGGLWVCCVVVPHASFHISVRLAPTPPRTGSQLLLANGAKLGTGEEEVP